MTPKEKAEELYRNYWVYFTYEQSVNSIFKHAKECALIAVDEILKSGKDVDEFADNYWLQVKTEIEKL